MIGRRMLTTYPIVAILAVAGTKPAVAQYDREGRYVPSPMGIPTDPHARPIPGYSGTPGGAIGEPIVPRGSIPTAPPTAPRPPQRARRASAAESVPLRVPGPAGIDARQCRRGWSAATGVTLAAFARRCREILRR